MEPDVTYAEHHGLGSTGEGSVQHHQADKTDPSNTQHAGLGSTGEGGVQQHQADKTGLSHTDLAILQQMLQQPDGLA